MQIDARERANTNRYNEVISCAMAIVDMLPSTTNGIISISGVTEKDIEETYSNIEHRVVTVLTGKINSGDTK